MKEFDDFIMVDWSAAKEPKTGKDSIWLARIGSAINYPTRQDFFVAMLDILEKAIKDKKRILCGFDFCFGLPAGAVAKMRKVKEDKSNIHDWHWLWNYLNENIEDDINDEPNLNNRFAVANNMNKLLSGGEGPFWGRPASYDEYELIPTKKEGLVKDGKFMGGMFEERRITENANLGQPVWKLDYPGAVGGQSLIGMAYLYKLRFLSKYESNIRVFPFENCDTAPVVFAESYYGRTGELKRDESIWPKDKGEVMAAVKWCSELQKKGKLKDHLCRPDNQIILQDEGWTFTEAPPKNIKCL